MTNEQILKIRQLLVDRAKGFLYQTEVEPYPYSIEDDELFTCNIVELFFSHGTIVDLMTLSGVKMFERWQRAGKFKTFYWKNCFPDDVKNKNIIMSGLNKGELRTKALNKLVELINDGNVDYIIKGEFEC